MDRWVHSGGPITASPTQYIYIQARRIRPPSIAPCAAETGPIESLFTAFSTSCYVTPGTLCCFRDAVSWSFTHSFPAEASMLLNR
ncbi:hypothetical protein CA13_57980 [Planctomycetes bacterium CA13]|uniref:Uncharacterized protein n=1 Tax=Novipirellula herctigrandis TaxID=2527986 RepID=A0A5C5ZBT5_9BACT|nr:hypothetical protein CA13_57980 [Planctomycetes bacterium CA13]